MVGYDGLRIFESEVVMDSTDNYTERRHWLGMCLPIQGNSCEVIRLQLNVDDPDVEADLFQNVFVKRIKSPTRLMSRGEVLEQKMAFQLAVSHMRKMAPGQFASLLKTFSETKYQTNAAPIRRWMHENVGHRH